jgi:hypothetical protein
MNLPVGDDGLAGPIGTCCPVGHTGARGQTGATWKIDQWMVGYKQAIEDLLIYIRLNGKDQIVQHLEVKQRACP